MAMNPSPLSIVGCGPGSAQYVTEAARQAVVRADVLVGGKRLMELFPDCSAERILVETDIAALLQEIATRRDAGQRIAVLVSGDPGLHSLARNVIQHFGREQCEVVPAVSSVQVAFARLGLDWADARILSAHGRTPNVASDELAGADRIAILAGTAEAIHWSAGIAGDLEASHRAYLAENLTLDGERFRQVTPDQLDKIDAASLSIVLLIRRSLLNDLSRFSETPVGNALRGVPYGNPSTPSWNATEGVPYRQPDEKSLGTLYGIGVGPGDPQWMTVKAVGILSTCRHVCVPKSALAADSVALEIARDYLRPDAVVHEQSYPMTADPGILREHWQRAAQEVHAILARGEDCCFLTLGDALLYSTYIYLLRELRAIEPALQVVTVPGVTAFSAAAALANRPLGEGKQLLTIVPASDDLDQFAAALDRGGTVVLMKVGRRLARVLDELEARNLSEQTIFVSRAGMTQQQVETDVRRLRGLSDKAGYLSIVIVQAKGP